MLKQVAPGDVVTVTRIDRLARSTFDLFAIVKQIVDAKAQFRSLAEPWADTGTSTGRLMLAVLGGLADVERDPHAGIAETPVFGGWFSLGFQFRSGHKLREA
jgi:DNA invertase Pin-like site-specific DNA recombinase